MQDNKLIRLNLLKRRWNLQPSKKTKLDHQIYLKTLQNITSRGRQNYIAFYWPMENEVDTIALIHELIKRHYKICLPSISKRKMVFKPIDSIHFEYEYWKSMKQPQAKEIISGRNISLMIIPMIGFNKSQRRLGYGFNHYNDYLNKYDHIHTIGLAYDFQRNDEFMTNRYDKMLNLIITN